MVLSLVRNEGVVTARDVATALGLSVTAASQALRCYHRSGDLSRYKRRYKHCNLGRPCYLYSISNKGLDKIKFFL